MQMSRGKEKQNSSANQDLLLQLTMSGNSEDLRALREIAAIICGSDVSPIEIIHPGLVGKLLAYLTKQSETSDNRLRSFLHVFLQCPVSSAAFFQLSLYYVHPICLYPRE